MRRGGVFVMGGILVSLAGLMASGQDKAPFKQTGEEVKLFELTNLERKKKDLPPFVLNPVLSKIARAHSMNMATQGKMLHELDNKKAKDRTREGGYKYAKLGENIGQSDAVVPLKDLMKAWMESPGHRENILLEAFTEIGIGIGRDDKGGLYYTQLFARPLKE